MEEELKQKITELIEKINWRYEENYDAVLQIRTLVATREDRTHSIPILNAIAQVQENSY